MHQCTVRKSSCTNHDLCSTCAEPSCVKAFSAIKLAHLHEEELAHRVVMWWRSDCIKGKGFPYRLPSVGSGADPGVPAVSPQVTISHPPGCRLPLLSARPTVTFPPQSITAPSPVPSYTAWWQKDIGVNNLSKAAMQLLSRDLNPRPVDRMSNALPVAPLLFRRSQRVMVNRG